MDNARIEGSRDHDSTFTAPQGEPDLKDYHQQKLIDSAYAVHRSCALSKDNPIARTEILRQVDQLKADGGLNKELMTKPFASDALKAVKTDADGNITQLSFSNCIPIFPDIKVTITPDGAKIDGKNYPASLKEQDKLLSDFASAQIDSPLKSLRDYDKGGIVKGPELSDQNKALAKKGYAAILSADEGLLKDFAKSVLLDPVQGAKALEGIHWQEPEIPLNLFTRADGERVLNVGSDFLGKMRLDAQGNESFYPSTMKPSQTKELGLKDIAAYSRLRLSSDYYLAESFYDKDAIISSSILRPSPVDVAAALRKKVEQELPASLRR